MIRHVASVTLKIWESKLYNLKFVRKNKIVFQNWIGLKNNATRETTDFNT